MHDAAETLQHISETESGERARRAAAGALVLRAVARARDGQTDAFGVRRAAREVEGLPSGPERAMLARILAALETPENAGALATALVRYACELEQTRRLPEANAAVTVALTLDAGGAQTALHAARLARKLGERDRALALYCAARDLDGGRGTVARLAAVGEALVSPDALPRLTRVVRAALRAGDAEAAAVGLEERAALRRVAGDLRGAARDLCAATLRFADGVDRARVCHALAGVLLADGDAEGAREALLGALGWGDAPQKDHATGRLHTLSRDVGDQVGQRRWRSYNRPALVSLSAYRPRLQGRTMAPRLARWRRALEATA